MPQAAHPPDEELLARAGSGDHGAFRMLVERYEGRVAATVIGMLGPGQEADDVGQETFIRLYESLDSFRREAKLSTYVTRIAINQSLKALRRRKRWTRRFFSRDEERPPPEPAVEGSQQIDEKERSDLVHRALQQLDDKHRAVVVLRMLEGHSTKETAEMLDIPDGTVMSRLSRALGKMEGVLKPLIEPEG